MSSKFKPTQKERILKILKRGRKLTQAQARTYNIMSLSSRVAELRRADVPIDSIPHRRKDGRLVVQYQLQA